MNWIKVADNMPEGLMLDVPYPWEDCKVLLNKKWVKGKFLSFKGTDEKKTSIVSYWVKHMTEGCHSIREFRIRRFYYLIYYNYA